MNARIALYKQRFVIDFAQGMIDTNRPKSKEFQAQLNSDEQLLAAIKNTLPELQHLLVRFQCLYEDGLYRFYHHSLKVYQLQPLTMKAVEIFRKIGQRNGALLCESFQQMVDEATAVQSSDNHNDDRLRHTRRIFEAFLQTKYFLEMMINYGLELDKAPAILPIGWAAILELYNQR